MRKNIGRISVLLLAAALLLSACGKAEPEKSSDTSPSESVTESTAENKISEEKTETAASEAKTTEAQSAPGVLPKPTQAPTQKPTEPTEKPTVPATQEPTLGGGDAPIELPDFPFDLFADFLFSEVNAYRKENGLPALTKDETLCRLAAVRAEEASKLWSHTRPNGESCFSVWDEFGVSMPQVCGENLLMTSKPDAKFCVREGWAKSDGHRKNMLEARFKRAGMATYTAKDGNVYIANLFSS